MFNVHAVCICNNYSSFTVIYTHARKHTHIHRPQRRPSIIPRCPSLPTVRQSSSTSLTSQHRSQSFSTGFTSSPFYKPPSTSLRSKRSDPRLTMWTERLELIYFLFILYYSLLYCLLEHSTLSVQGCKFLLITSFNTILIVPLDW